MSRIVFELCAETLSACVAACDGGADRIELCSGLCEGGVTPSHGLIAGAVRLSRLPVHVLIRPRGGDFVYTAEECAVMREDVVQAKRLGAAGVVLGVLLADNTVDAAATAEMMALARPMRITFHRAFDAVRSQSEALETLIGLSCDRVLTSGGKRNVVAGAARLRALVTQADGRIEVAVGGGLRVHNATAVARRSGARHFHGSMRVRAADGGYMVTSASLKKMRELLEQAQV